jgi:4-hydroxybenzoate polyprenyltransferase
MMQTIQQKWANFTEMTRLFFSLFGLPFVVAGAVLPGVAPSWSLIWLIPGFFSARISGMAFNAWIDEEIDRKNPRTVKRAVPSGRMKRQTAIWISILSLSIFFLICLQINLWTTLLGTFAGAIIALYSFTKRFTWLCHYILASIHFISIPMATSLMIGEPTVSSCLLGLVAFCNIAGSDIIWSLQDLKHDQTEGLWSIPACFGEKRAKLIALLTHFGAVVAAFYLSLASGFSLVSLIGYPLTLTFTYGLCYLALSKGDIPRLFFLCNIAIPLITLFFVTLGVVCTGM